MKTITFKINSIQDRRPLIIALANNGYKVWVEEKENEGRFHMDTNIYVHVELAQKES